MHSRDAQVLKKLDALFAETPALVKGV
jgi:hypothetical protein